MKLEIICWGINSAKLATVTDVRETVDIFSHRKELNYCTLKLEHFQFIAFSFQLMTHLVSLLKFAVRYCSYCTLELI